MRRVKRISSISHSKMDKNNSHEKIKMENSRQRTKNFKQQYNKFDVEKETEEDVKEELTENEKKNYISPKHQTRFSDSLNTAMQRRRLGLNKNDDSERE